MVDYELLKTLSDYNEVENTALCSIVSFRGSVPRKDYPTMLVFQDGDIKGTIGGGLIEQKVIIAAGRTIKTNQPQLLKLEMLGNDPEEESGLCGGWVNILIEPFSDHIKTLLKSIQSTILQRKSDLLITKVNAEKPIVVERYLQSSQKIANTLSGELDSAIQKAADSQKADDLKIVEDIYCIEPISHKPVLHIFGAGHVGQAVAQIADLVNIPYSIYDDRENLANKTNFPNAIRVSNSLEKIHNSPDFSKNDLALSVTRGHKQDLEILRKVLPMNLKYVGQMCSKKKWDVLRKALISEGFSEEQVESVYAPVGLKIGAETVPELAICIVAEIIQVLNK